MVTPVKMPIRSYSKLRLLKTFEERYEYLRLNKGVGEISFGFDRYLNQSLYRSTEWRQIRDSVIIRDNGCDLGLSDFEIKGKIIVHHMNPITPENLEDGDENILNPEFLICVSNNTHLAIHYGDKSLLPEPLIVRRPNDTIPWRQDLKRR